MTDRSRYSIFATASNAAGSALIEAVSGAITLTRTFGAPKSHEYFLFPSEELMPEWVGKFRDILSVLASSTEATPPGRRLLCGLFRDWA